MAKKLSKAAIAKLENAIEHTEKLKAASTKSVMLTAAEKAAITPEDKASKKYGIYGIKLVPVTDDDRANYQRFIDSLKSELSERTEQ